LYYKNYIKRNTLKTFVNWDGVALEVDFLALRFVALRLKSLLSINLNHAKTSL